MTNDPQKNKRPSLDDIFMGKNPSEDDAVVRDEAPESAPVRKSMEELFYGSDMDEEETTVFKPVSAQDLTSEAERQTPRLAASEEGHDSPSPSEARGESDSDIPPTSPTEARPDASEGAPRSEATAERREERRSEAIKETLRRHTKPERGVESDETEVLTTEELASYAGNAQYPTDSARPMDADDDADEEIKSSPVKEVFFGWVIPILSALVLAFFIKTFIGSVTTVRGTSMEPSFQDGNVLIVSKIPTYFHNYERGDVLIIDSPDQKELYIKRLIGMPGEMVTIQEGHVYIDGKYEVREAYTDAETASYDETSWTLGEDEYFVMGDNRAEGASNDSRIFGPIDQSEIEAVARLRIWPLQAIRSLY